MLGTVYLLLELNREQKYRNVLCSRCACLYMYGYQLLDYFVSDILVCPAVVKGYMTTVQRLRKNATLNILKLI